jgi:hypothetical protein
MQTILEPQSLASTSLQELVREILVRLGEDPERDCGASVGNGESVRPLR